jgi:hypothetical protein
MGLLNDLFPKTLELVPRAVDTTFEARVSVDHRVLHGHRYAQSEATWQTACTKGIWMMHETDNVYVRWCHFCLQTREAAIELGYQPDEMFLLKISQVSDDVAVSRRTNPDGNFPRCAVNKHPNNRVLIVTCM